PMAGTNRHKEYPPKPGCAMLQGIQSGGSTFTRAFLLFSSRILSILRAMHVRSFTGGIFDTNCFLVECPGGNLLIDAPQDAADWLRKEQIRVDYLLLTHGHFDHIIDAAAIASAHKCPVAVHPDSAPMLSDRSFFQRFGFQLEVQP